jgi:hypothetical protein
MACVNIAINFIMAVYERGCGSKRHPLSSKIFNGNCVTLR